MKLGIILIVVCSCSAKLGLTLDCSTLNHINPVRQEPADGSDLPYCQTSDDQCCTHEYLDSLKNTTLEYLRLGLQKEFLGSNYNTLKSINNETLSFMQQFAGGFIDRLPGMYAIDSQNQKNLLDSFTPLIMGLTSMTDGMAPPSSLSLAQINTTINNMIQTLLNHVIRDYIQSNNFLAMTNFVALCYRNMLYDGYINTTVQSELVISLHKLLTTVSLLNEISSFYSNQLIPLLTSMQLPRDCVERSLSLKCASCRRVIPDLCHSVCQQLVLGCYSPYRRALINQLNILWNVTNQILEAIRTQVNDVIQLVTVPTRLLNLDLESTTSVQNFINAVAVDCHFLIFNFAASTRTDLSQVIFTQEIFNKANALEGSYNYSHDGPLTCEMNPKMNCWDGEEEVADDQSNEEEFITDDILEQDNNPVVSFNRSELVQIAISIGTPVSDFLTQDSIQKMIPAGLLIPSATEFRLEIPKDIHITTTTTRSTASNNTTHISSIDATSSIPQTTTGTISCTQSMMASTPSPTNRLSASSTGRVTHACLTAILLMMVGLAIAFITY